ncbi:HAD-IIIA family hydrolase, partial [Patescibacteria group bacterium]|nr:HAD-IIIA family hydrolase [Patescibacteria group bacterium]
QGLRQLNEMKIPLFIVSNQSCVQRGMITLERALSIHEIVLQRLAEHGIEIRDSRICPHVDADGCECRKPKPGMILDLCSFHGIDPTCTVMIGDSDTDIQAGQRSHGALQIYIGTLRPDVLAAIFAPDLNTAVQKIMNFILG